MDNLPNDPPDNNPPPAFGTHFDPHSNPIDPNNPLGNEVTTSSAFLDKIYTI